MDIDKAMKEEAARTNHLFDAVPYQRQPGDKELVTVHWGPAITINPACTGKHGYPTKALAIRMVEQRTRRPNRRTRHKNRSFKSRDRKAGVYKCKACRLWHIGHSESL
jgi:hypothetical protein